MRDLTGVLCATLTPFLYDIGAVDEAWIAAHLRFLEAHGVDGVLVLGTTGEGPSLSFRERERVIDIVLAERGNLSVVAATGCAALPDTIALSHSALAKGVDAILVMPPFYFKNVPESGVLTYFRALCDTLPEEARMLLYHIPAVTGVPITPGIIEGLLESHPGQFYGLKDSSGDTFYLTELLRNHPQLQVFVGHEQQVLNGLYDGAAGIISAIANVWPGAVRAVLDAHTSDGDVAHAQARLSDLFTLLAGNTPPLLKVALPWVSDLPRTSVRVPLTNLSAAEAARLRENLDALGLLSS